MSFTRKHFEAIAQVIAESTITRKDYRPHGWTIAAPELIDALVEMFGDDNARFDAVKFRKACEQHAFHDDNDDGPRCCNVCSQKLDSAYKAHETVCGACINAFDDEGVA